MKWFLRWSTKFGWTGYDNPPKSKDKDSSVDSQGSMGRGRDKKKNPSQSDSKGDK